MAVGLKMEKGESWEVFRKYGRMHKRKSENTAVGRGSESRKQTMR